MNDHNNLVISFAGPLKIEEGDNRKQLAHIERLLGVVIQNQEKIMATLDQFQAALSKIDTATTAIADLIRSLKDQLTNNGLPAADEAAVLARLEGIASSLDAMGKDPANPVPEPPPTT